MKAWRDTIESGFERIGHHICTHPFLTITIFACLAGLLMAQLPKTTIDTSPTGMLRPNDPAMIHYNEFRDQFGRDELIFIAVGPVNVFSLPVLEKIRALHLELEEKVPYLEEVTSVLNARSTRGEDDTLIVEDLMEDWPQSSQDLDAIKQRALSTPLYHNMLLNEEGTFTTLAIKTSAFKPAKSNGFDAFSQGESAPAKENPDYIKDEENGEIVQMVRAIVNRHSGKDFPLYVAGSPVLTEDIRTYMLHDMKIFSVLAILLIALLLAVVFRTWAGVVWPLMTVVLSLACTLGIMAWFGVPLKLPTQILPSFILAVGVGDSVHILAIYYRGLRQGLDREQAIVYSLGHSGLAVVLTSLTTAGGLLSFARTDIAPIADLGVFSAVGVLLALCFSLFLMPALLAVFPSGARKHSPDQHSRLDRFLSAIGEFGVSHPKAILGTTGVILLVSALGISMLHFSHHTLSWFPDDSDIRVSTAMIDKNMRGSLTMEVVVDTGMENGFYDPDRLQALSSLADKIEPYASEKVYVGQTQSVADIIKEINQALHENNPKFYTVPRDPALVAQEFLLFENSGSDDLENAVDTDFSKARFTIKLPSVDAVYYHDVVNDINRWFHASFPQDKVTVTGLLTLLYSTFYAVMHTMAESYIIAIVVITILMIFMIGNLRLGLISMIPNIAPIVVCLGVMGALDLTLNAFTILIGSVALGLAVDDTIHFMHNFRRYYSQSGDVHNAVHETMQSTGRAMLFTTVALTMGFIVFLFATMENLVTYGALAALTISLALLADFLVVPALLALVIKESPAPSQHDIRIAAHYENLAQHS
ncbi:MAG: RND family transporter [Desulfatibacillum sp.]|nr:RND family transporter [Desulfatibacillum sp.]